jgi:hypothetical protein
VILTSTRREHFQLPSAVAVVVAGFENLHLSPQPWKKTYRYQHVSYSRSIVPAGSRRHGSVPVLALPG